MRFIKLFFKQYRPTCFQLVVVHLCKFLGDILFRHYKSCWTESVPLSHRLRQVLISGTTGDTSCSSTCKNKVSSNYHQLLSQVLTSVFANFLTSLFFTFSGISAWSSPYVPYNVMGSAGFHLAGYCCDAYPLFLHSTTFLVQRNS